MGTVTHKNEKYITFKREDFYQMMGQLALPPHAAPDGSLVGTDWDSAPIAQKIEALAEEVSLDDAVVIRRQDLFASPCLATYASMIAMVAKSHGDAEVGKELQTIADYFEDQAQHAAAEGYKLPTL